jgi:ribosome-associated translation inhibitor RaiA
MKLDIRCRGTQKNETLVQHVQRKLAFALGRFDRRVRRVVVRLEDVNGPRGGVDKVCRVEAVSEFGVHVVEARDVQPFAAVDRALEMIERAVARSLRKTRDLTTRTAEGF